MAILARTTLLLATVLVACFALMQVTGRLVFSHLARFEERVNAHLESTGVSSDGLAGSWRYLNPSVRAASVTFGGGELEGLELELDVAESLWRNRLVARRIHVGSARLRFIRTPSGWRLGGKAGETELDDFLEHSDEVRLAGRIELEGYTATGAVYGELKATNRDGRHRWHAAVYESLPQTAGTVGKERPSTESECRCLFIDLDLVDVGADRPAGGARFIADGVRVAGELAAALSVPEFVVDVDGRWTGDGTRAAVTADARLNAMATPLDMVVSAVAQAVGDDPAYQGVASVRARASDASVSVDGIRLSADSDGVGLAFSSLDIAALNALLASGLGAHGHWFEGVAAGGRMEAVRAHLGWRGVAYEARLDDVFASNYRGIPQLANGCGHLRGHLRSFRIDFRCEAVRFGLPRHFDGAWEYDVASGDITFWFGRDYLGARANLEVALDGAVGGGGFSLSRPRDPLEGRFVLLGLADGLTAAMIKRYLPLELERGLRDWLMTGLAAGQLNAASTVYHGHTRTRPGLPNRRFELAGLVIDGVVDYHEDWPVAEALHGSLAIAGGEARARVAEGVLFGERIRNSAVRVPQGGGYVDIELAADAGVARALEFVRTTPLANELSFVGESWRGEGELGIGGSLRIPLDDRHGPADIDLAFDLDDVSLDLVDLRLLFANLEGSAGFRSPHYLSATAVQGTLFGLPVEISASASRQANVLDIRGRGTVEDVYRILETREFQAVEGEFGFNAQYWTYVDPSRPPILNIESDGVGIAVRLPQPLHKTAPQSRRLEVELVFDEDYTRADVRGETFSGWFHARDGALARGGIGIGVPPERPNLFSSDMRLSGRLKRIRVGEYSDALIPDTIPWRLDDLMIESVEVGGIEITEVAVNGVARRGEVVMGLDSNEVRGTFVRHGEQPVLVWLDEIRLSEDETEGDPLDVSIFDRVPAADVTIARAVVGEDDHGTWTFGVRPGDGMIRLIDLIGDIKGIHIEAADDVVWSEESDTSRFTGRLTAGDLSEVLPMWGYAPSIESTTVDIEAAVEWSGSPLNFELDDLTGNMTMAVNAGRFVDVDEAAGAQILALLNFANIARRLKLDFSDLFGRGIGFDQVRGNGEFDEGVLSFANPMEISGSDSDFSINGTIDLGDGTLNNEMIVTLPLSSNLPWYAWIATAEPATAVGVLLGREIFKEQLRTLSSARYRITGTIEEPNLEFVDIFRSEMDRPEEVE